jgi:uncharacterized protein YwgA
MRAALLTCLIQKLRTHGSWCGETHLQKATYLLQYMMKVPFGFEFILYKHGPFSFDLRDDLTALRADGLIKLEPQRPYGPRLEAAPECAYIQELFSSTILKYENVIEFVSGKLAEKGVADLERLTTAFFVTRGSVDKQCVNARAAELNRIKPHISIESATSAVSEIDRILNEAKALH